MLVQGVLARLNFGLELLVLRDQRIGFSDDFVEFLGQLQIVLLELTQFARELRTGVFERLLVLRFLVLQALSLL